MMLISDRQTAPWIKDVDNAYTCAILCCQVCAILMWSYVANSHLIVIAAWFLLLKRICCCNKPLYIRRQVINYFMQHVYQERNYYMSDAYGSLPHVCRWVAFSLFNREPWSLQWYFHKLVFQATLNSSTCVCNVCLHATVKSSTCLCKCVFTRQREFQHLRVYVHVCTPQVSDWLLAVYHHFYTYICFLCTDYILWFKFVTFLSDSHVPLCVHTFFHAWFNASMHMLVNFCAPSRPAWIPHSIFFFS